MKVDPPSVPVQHTTVRKTHRAGLRHMSEKRRSLFFRENGTLLLRCNREKRRLDKSFPTHRTSLRVGFFAGRPIPAGPASFGTARIGRPVSGSASGAPATVSACTRTRAAVVRH